MDTLITTLISHIGPNKQPHTLTRTSDGILYAVAGVTANQLLDTRPTSVYVSTDNGLTWEKDVEWVQARSAGNHSHCCAHIAIDGHDTVHVAWSSWNGTHPNRHGYLSYATKPKGGSWSGVTDITDYVEGGGASLSNAVLSMVIDGLNQVHILYLVRQYPATPEYYNEHHWYDGSWHKETVYGGYSGVMSILTVDPDNTLYQLYRDAGYTRHLGTKPLGGSWSTEELPFTVISFCSDKDGNLHFVGGTKYRRRNSDLSWGDEETYTTATITYANISVSQDGIVRILGGRGSPQYKWRCHTRTLLGVWSYVDIGDWIMVLGVGAAFLHAIFPVYGTYYPCLLKSGYAFVYETTQYRFAADPEIPAPSVIYPSDAITRVTGIRHIYRPGSYRLEATLGDVSTSIEVPQRDIQIPTVVPADSTKIPKPPKTIPLRVPEKTAPELIEALREEGIFGASADVTATEILEIREGILGQVKPLSREDLEKLGTIIGQEAPPEPSFWEKLTPWRREGAASFGEAASAAWRAGTPWKEERGETFGTAFTSTFRRGFEEVAKLGESYKKFFGGLFG